MSPRDVGGRDDGALDPARVTEVVRPPHTLPQHACTPTHLERSTPPRREWWAHLMRETHAFSQQLG